MEVVSFRAVILRHFGHYNVVFTYAYLLYASCMSVTDRKPRLLHATLAAMLLK